MDYWEQLVGNGVKKQIKNQTGGTSKDNVNMSLTWFFRKKNSSNSFLKKKKIPHQNYLEAKKYDIDQLNFH